MYSVPWVFVGAVAGWFFDWRVSKQGQSGHRSKKIESVPETQRARWRLVAAYLGDGGCSTALLCLTSYFTAAFAFDLLKFTDILPELSSPRSHPASALVLVIGLLAAVVGVIGYHLQAYFGRSEHKLWERS